MPNPIDSENVIAWLNAQIEKVQGGWLHDYGFPTNVIAALTDVKRFVKNLPTIEAETVRHGRWVDVPDDNTRIAKCSLCGFWQRTNCDDKTGKHLIHNAVYRYCAGCGARMDGGADNG